MKCVASYDQYITIQSMTASTDAHGHTDTTSESNWSDYTTSYASVKSKGGREFWKVDQVSADVSHVWMCPYSAKIAAATPQMRIEHEGNTYEILSVIDIDLAHDEVEIQTRRAV